MPKQSDPIELQPIRTSKPDLPPRHPDAVAGGSLHSAYRAAEEKAKAAVHLQEGGLDNISIWGLVSAGWFGLLAVPALLFPRILLFFAQTPPVAIGVQSREDHYDALTPLESHLTLSVSLGLIAFSLISIFVLVPSYHPPATNPARKPLLGILVGLTSLLSLISFNTGSLGGLGTVLGIGHSVVALWGWWTVVFGGVKTKAKRSNVPSRLKRL